MPMIETPPETPEEAAELQKEIQRYWARAHKSSTPSESKCREPSNARSSTLKVNDLILLLLRLGYRNCKPAGRTWFMGFVLRRNDSVLCVLFRKNGIDLRHYSKYVGGISIDLSNVAHISGGEIFRNHYNESANCIHMKVATIASCFSVGILRDELRTQDGRSYRLNSKYQSIRENSKAAFQQRSQEMRDDAQEKAIWDYVRNDCGGYIGEGDWL